MAWANIATGETPNGALAFARLLTNVVMVRNPFNGLWPWDARKRVAEAIALARQSYLATEMDDARAAWVDVRRLQETLAHVPGTGGSVVGGAAVGAIIGVGTDHIRVRCEAAQAELIRAAETHGARPTVSDLLKAWSEFIHNGLPALRTLIIDNLKPHVQGASSEGNVNAAFEGTFVVTRQSAASAFGHFVAAHDRDRRDSRLKAAARAGWILVGIAATKFSDLLWNLLSRVPH